VTEVFEIFSVGGARNFYKVHHWKKH